MKDVQTFGGEESKILDKTPQKGQNHKNVWTGWTGEEESKLYNLSS